MKVTILLSALLVLCFIENANGSEFIPKRLLEDENEEDAVKPVAKTTTATTKTTTAAAKTSSEESGDEESEEKPAEEAPEEDEDEKAARIQKEIEAMNENTKRAFANQFDSSEDFSYDNMNNFMSGDYEGEMSEDQKIAAFAKLIKTGPVSFILFF